MALRDRYGLGLLRTAVGTALSATRFGYRRSWGDSSISHPFFSTVVTFRFLEEHTGLRPTDPWFARLRDAHLEPWGTGASDQFTLALRVGSVAHAIAWARQREYLGPPERVAFDEWFAHVLRRALSAQAT